MDFFVVGILKGTCHPRRLPFSRSDNNIVAIHVLVRYLVSKLNGITILFHRHRWERGIVVGDEMKFNPFANDYQVALLSVKDEQR